MLIPNECHADIIILLCGLGLRAESEIFSALARAFRVVLQISAAEGDLVRDVKHLLLLAGVAARCGKQTSHVQVRVPVEVAFRGAGATVRARLTAPDSFLTAGLPEIPVLIKIRFCDRTL